MTSALHSFHRVRHCALVAGLMGTLACGPAAWAQARGVLNLTGANEVPAVNTPATGTGAFTVALDGSVSGSIKTSGVAGTAAHLHIGAAGTNGPVVLALTQTAEGVWSVPPGAKLSPEQVRAYKAGALYVNVHSAAKPGGEVRAQLVPQPPH